MPNSHQDTSSPLFILQQVSRLFKYMRPYWLQFTTGMIFLIISSFSGLLFPKLLGQLVDAGKQGHLAGSIQLTGLLLMATLLVQSAFSFLRVILFVNVAEKTLSDLRQHIYNHLIQLPFKFFLNRRVGELSSRISADISLLQETFTTTLGEFIRQLITIIGGLVLLMMISVKLTGLILALFPVILSIAVVFGRFIRRYSRQVQEKIALSNTVVEETLQGIVSVKSFANEFFEMKRYKHHANEAARAGIKGGVYRGAFSSFIILSVFGALAGVIWQGVAMGMEAGHLFSFVLYAVFIGNSAAGLAEVYSNIQKSMGATEHLFELLDEPAEPLTNVTRIAPEHVLQGEINFNHITFHYPNREDNAVLQQLSFNVAKNQRVAIVGPSGAGKSTIASLLLRLYDPVDGHILFDGKDSQAIPLSALRSQVAIVPQDVFLFGGSIGENIAYGKQGASHEEIIEAAQKANAWEFIKRFPQGLDTLVGERGVQLSGGQRQRIAIARAVLKAPRILILDEATSALDAESEKLVQLALDTLMEGRSSIVIAHRLATVRQADKIIVLDKGRIMEAGTHEELINVKNGLYKNLCDMQFSL